MAESTRGEPMLYELASAAPGLLEDTLSSPVPPAALQQALPASKEPAEAEPASKGANEGPAAAALTNGRQHRGGPRRQPTVDVHAESRRLMVISCALLFAGNKLGCSYTYLLL